MESKYFVLLYFTQIALCVNKSRIEISLNLAASMKYLPQQKKNTHTFFIEFK